MKQRRYGREIALKILYQRDSSGRPLDEIILNTFDNEQVTPMIRNFAIELSQGALDNMESIDAILSKLAQHWKMERMAVIDRNILRIAIFELSFRPNTPTKVIINEAIEVAKKYGDSKSYQFINGVL